jgi:hypothetical protein
MRYEGFTSVTMKKYGSGMWHRIVYQNISDLATKLTVLLNKQPETVSKTSAYSYQITSHHIPEYGIR